MALGTIVVLLVTTNAGTRRFPVIRRLVTCRTLHINVLANQCETCRCMVEFGLFPVALVMTVGAFGTQCALVHVVFAMANAALGRRLAIFLTRHVTLIALKGLVFATQQEVALTVIKLFLVKVDHLRLAPLVIGVTNATRLGFLPRMKACLGSHISAYILVAIGAQSRLRAPVELDVALLAVVFQFGMPLDKLAGCQNGFDALRSRKPRPDPRTCQQHEGHGKTLALRSGRYQPWHQFALPINMREPQSRARSH